MNLEKKNQEMPEDLRHVCKRVQEKSESYRQYNFSKRYNDFLKAFFDLAQEYDSLDDFYRVVVSVPFEIIGIKSALYLYSEQANALQLVCSSDLGVCNDTVVAEYPVQLGNVPYDLSGSYIIPIFSKQRSALSSIGCLEDQSSRQTKLWDNLKDSGSEKRPMGMYQILGAEALSESDKFFFVKYANRVGYNLANRILATQNIEHLKFINSLIIDIEHNVIVPNMYFKHLFKQLYKKIDELTGIQDELGKVDTEGNWKKEVGDYQLKLKQIHNELLVFQQEIVKHHSSTSLFLESLFRREHFEQGQLVLHPKRCLIEKDVIQPQLEHYSSRLKAAGVDVKNPSDMLEEEITILVDVGLLAQVYANFFSNAAKYTQEIVGTNGARRKMMAYGREIIENFPCSGQRGVKFNVFTTGPAMSVEKGNCLYQEGVRGEGQKHIPGIGHGLSFVRQVVEMHGGKVGYEPTFEGNNFFFILPVPRSEYQPLLLPNGQ